MNSVLYTPFQWHQFNAVVGLCGGKLCLLRLGTDAAALEAQLQAEFPDAKLSNNPLLVREVQAFLAGDRTTLSIPLEAQGTPFQQRVWQELQRIPRGQTITYQTLAARMGMPKAVRAAANACGANPIALIIPCHRVLRSDGSLGGYHWGLPVKQALLDAEALPAKKAA